jgi:hypothetical protein
MGFVLLFSIIIGGYIGSIFVVDKRFELSKKTIHYITSILGFIIGITFLITGINE